MNDLVALRCGGKILPSDRTLIMGILNITPDSFSDGGRFYSHERAIKRGQKLIEHGADIIDIGGVSTAPGAADVSIDEELRRVIPVIFGLSKNGIKNISIDTMRSRVAQEAISAGASWINDQSAATFDEYMPEIMRDADAVVLMHNGAGKNTGVLAGEKFIYADVIKNLIQFFKTRIELLSSIGIGVQKIILDPGIGFGKGLADSLSILNQISRLNELGTKSLVGISRKSFLGVLTGIVKPRDRDFATLGGHAVAVCSGANILRTHNVKATLDFLKVLDRCMASKAEGAG